MQRLREGADKGEEIKKLRGDLEKLEEENRELKDRLTKIESRLSPDGAKPRGAKKAASKAKASRSGARPRKALSRTRRVATAPTRR
jgi:predicted RNase H-like nuclease (RuvC/YqgF family)